MVAYPTEAVYGLGCDPDDRQAIERILRIKQRPPAKGLILIAADLEQLTPYLSPLSQGRLEVVLRSWPGPVTWLWPARPGVSSLLRGDHDTLAVRVTAHPVAAALCRAAGTALVSTSANVSGGPPARSAAGVERLFGPRIDLVLEGEVDRTAAPTQIRDALTGRILRAST